MEEKGLAEFSKAFDRRSWRGETTLFFRVQQSFVGPTSAKRSSREEKVDTGSRTTLICQTKKRPPIQCSDFLQKLYKVNFL